MTYFFTADEHYTHQSRRGGIIEYCNRPFSSVEEMDEIMIENHNKVVKRGDITVHGGDFTLMNTEHAEKIIKKLNGQHVFLDGSHDYWLHDAPDIWEKKIGITYVVVCHYAMRVWPRSHYNSIQLYGHSHGNLPPVGKQHDIGVDNNDFYPVSFDQILEIMKSRDDNFNLVGGR